MGKIESLVSVCIPTYNGEQYIEEALDSILEQTYRNLEVIISDDQSTDGTLEVIKNFKTKEIVPIRIFSNKPRGIGANWNNCIRKANGKYIKFLFQDDVLYPECIEELVYLIENNKNVELSACKRKILVMGDRTPEIENWIRIYGDLQKHILLCTKGVSLISKRIFRHKSFLEIPRNKIGEPTATLFKRALVKEVGYFREDLDQILDYEFYYRILKKHNIALTNKELVIFRVHDAQASSVNRKLGSKDHLLYESIVYKNYFKLLGFQNQKNLFLKYHRVGKAIKRILDGKL